MPFFLRKGNLRRAQGQNTRMMMYSQRSRSPEGFEAFPRRRPRGRQPSISLSPRSQHIDFRAPEDAVAATNIRPLAQSRGSGLLASIDARGPDVRHRQGPNDRLLQPSHGRRTRLSPSHRTWLCRVTHSRLIPRGSRRRAISGEAGIPEPSRTPASRLREAIGFWQTCK